MLIYFMCQEDLSNHIKVLFISIHLLLVHLVYEHNGEILAKNNKI